MECLYSNVDCIKEFLSHDPNIDQVKGCLFASIRYSNIDLVKLIIEYGVDPNIEYSINPIIRCSLPNIQHEYFSHNRLLSRDEYDRTIQLLLNRTSNPLAKSGRSRTPLIEAVDTEDLTIIKYLISKGCNINQQNITGDSALHVAVERLQGDYDDWGNLYYYDIDNLEEIIKYLLYCGADASLCNNQGHTPKDIALRYYKRSEVERLFSSHIGKATKRATS